MAAGFLTAHLDDVPPRDDLPGSDWLPLRAHFDIRAFGVNAWRAREAGAEVVEEHDEAEMGHEELYVVVAGRARFRVGEAELDAPAGTLVFVEPGLRRVAHALEAGTTVLALGARRGEAFSLSAWEVETLAGEAPGST